MSEELCEDCKEHEDRLAKAVQELMEYYDCVSIFVSRDEPARDRTLTMNRGGGNILTRYGQAKCWVIQEEERMREGARSDE